MPIASLRQPAPLRILVLMLTATLFAADEAVLPLVPWPAKVETHAGGFRLGAATRIRTVGADPALVGVATGLAARLRVPTGLPLPVEPGGDGEDAVVIGCDGDAAKLGPEGYHLEVGAGGVRISAATVAGAFYATQTLLQLLPAEAFGRDLAAGQVWQAPAVSIEDRPRYRWRGLMLDVGRHFFGRDSVLRLLDEMALHKFNVLHLHLTEDQGWRLQIRKHPELTVAGARRASSPEANEPYGPYFYTQDDIRAIVAHAREVGIEVIPEIEMPGHSLAALTCYPELSCRGGPFEVRTKWGVEQDVYCAGNDATFAFLQDVLDEVIELFPSRYIHIGGDECPKTRWKACPKCQERMRKEGLKDEHDLQSWFIRRIAAYLASKGRRIIGWDEILEGSPIADATVTVWRDAKAGAEAARRGGDVIMCPGSHCYFDHAQTGDPGEPKAIGSTILPLEKVYAFDPMPPGMDPALVPRLIGVQGNVWTEYIPGFRHVEYMTWPRAAALAEVGWSPAESRDFAAFQARLAVDQRRLGLLGVNSHPLGGAAGANGGTVVWRWSPHDVAESWKTIDTEVGAQLAKPGTYAVAFRFRGGAHRLDVASAALVVDGQVAAMDTHAGSAGANASASTYTLTLPARPPQAKVLLRVVVRSDGGTDSNGEVVLAPR
jgi:hexosaminidase